MELRRTFYDLSDKDVDDAERMASLRRSAFGKGSDWDDVLKSRLIILLSEAQSGKTYECQARQQKLWEAGEASFYVELVSVAAQPWSQLRSPDETERLERWRRSESEVTTVFLDSVDELKLTQGRFQAALRNVANDLHGQMRRARIVLTSRPLPVDRELFLKTFAATTPNAVASEDDFAELMTGKSKRDNNEGTPPEVRYVSLLALTADDVARLAAARGVTDTDAFLDGLQSASMLEFMRRPQDVIEAASAWQELGGRFGSHALQVEFDIRARLKPNATRQDRPLEDGRAYDGAKRLALAVALSHRLTIRHDVNHDPGDAATVLEPATILNDWRDDDRKALLERGLFGFSTYGRVRFHNRLAFEFLAAAHLSDLLDAGLSRKAVRRLLVVQTAQGFDVIRPSLRDVAAWLALRQPWVFELVNRLDPALLMNLGDPGSLSIEQRQKALAAFIERFGPGGWRGLAVPEIQIHRIADASLEPTIREHFNRIENSEVRQTLLDLIGQGRLAGCADLARQVLQTKDAEPYERFDALDALVALDDPSLAEVVTALRSGPGPWDHRFARFAVYRLFPKHMRVADLVATLGWLEETRSTGSELSRNLPALVVDLSRAELEQLREGLKPLVSAGLRFDDQLHATRNDRPHLVHVFAAACARLIEADALAPGDAASVALAAALARGMRSDEDVPSNLAARVDGASMALRSAIFAEDVRLLRLLRPDQERLDLFTELVWRGTLRLGSEDDGWLRAFVVDQGASADIRAAGLLMAVFTMADETAEQLDALKALVADDPELVAFVENRQTSRDRSRQQRRYEICNKRRKRQQERREAKAKASWVMFWRDLTSDPEKAFSSQEVETTSWNLWRVMKRGSARSRSSGWDRALIEQYLGMDVANHLRAALMPVWRRESPPLTSELPPEERDTLYERWILGFAAIGAEAEDPAWADHLTLADVDKAVRYVAIAGSDFPAWLESLAVRHGDIVDRVLGGELSWALSKPAGQQGYSIALQNISHGSPETARLFLPRLRSWLSATGGLPQESDHLAGGAQRLDQIIQILLKFGDGTDRSMIADLAAAALTRGCDDAYEQVWLPALFEVNPELAVARLELICKTAGVARDNKAVVWFARLFGEIRHGRGVNLHVSEMTPELLIRILRLSYRHVDRNDDEFHEGSFSPNVRDNAEMGRNMLLNAILDLGGPEGWAVKQEIAADPMFAHFRDRLHTLAVERSARDADHFPMRPDEIAKLDADKEPGPRTAAEMFALIIDRLDDLRDHLLDDSSPWEMWAGVTDERVMRRAIAERLEQDARGAYSVAQEGVTAEEKETDMRLRSPVNAIEGVIELKIGDKPYSAADLRKVAPEQLVAKYLAPSGRRAGCVLITRAVRGAWQHPDTGQRLDFDEMIAMLSEEAKALQQRFPDEIHIDVVGLDLGPRLSTERVARGRKDVAGSAESQSMIATDSSAT